MKLICVEDVIMEDGERTFTKDKEYRAYSSTIKDHYDVVPVLRAKNDQGRRHIIKRLKNDSLDKFFNKLFVIMEG